MSSNKRRKVENEGQSGSSGQWFGVEMDSLKQRYKDLESNNYLLRAQNQLLRAHASSDTLLLLQQMTEQLTNGVTIDMSLSKVQSLEDNSRRDSFSGRVCGDLSEVILQFLPIDDKFCFECVSKRFQRTVFQRHFELIIEEVMCENLNRFETIVQKLPNIKSLKSDINLNNEEIEVIIKNCNQLIEFNIDLSRNSSEIRKSFADRFGPQLTSFSIITPNIRLFINSLVNIQELEYSDNRDLNDLIDFYTQFKAKSLRKVFICLSLHPTNLRQFSDIQSKYFKTFIDNNKTVTHLSLRFVGYLRNTDNPLCLSLGSISQLNQLISLNIVSDLRGKQFFESFKSDFTLIADNCRKLKSLTLGFYQMTQNSKDFMCDIKKFRELKRLEFSLKLNSGFTKKAKNYFINSLNTGFQRLTHLTIDFDDYVFNENFLDTIDTNLANLQNLIIVNKVIVTERTADILSRLSRLENLSLMISSKRDQNDIFFIDFEEKVIEKCRKLKSLKLDW